MNLITVSSDSHDELLNRHLLPSLPSTLTPIVVKIEQRGSGNHGYHPEYLAAMKDKMSIVLQYTRTEKNPFMYCDADIRFNPLLNPVPFLLKALEEHKLDIVCQRDGDEMCAGFVVIDPSEKNVNYIQDVVNHMDANPSLCDQRAFRELHRSALYPNERKPRMGLLDVNCGFGNTNHLYPNVLWTPEKDWLEQHRDLVQKQFMWHANHTYGVNHKMEMLDRFKVIYEAKPT